MASKRQKFEADLLRLRNHACWEKLSEGIKLLINKYGQSDYIVRLLENEIELEEFLVENEPRHDNIKKAQSTLVEVRRNLDELQSCDCKTSVFQVSEEAALLFAKVLYAQGNITACLDVYEKLKLMSIANDTCHMYKMRMYAEALSIKGLCHEQLSSAMSNESYNQVVECYEHAVHLMMRYLLEFEKTFSSHNMISDDNLVSFVVETTIHRFVVLHIKHNNVWRGIALLRKILKTLHSHLPLHMQQAFCCKLSTILMRGTSTVNYQLEESSRSTVESSADSRFLNVNKKSDFVSDSGESALPSNNSSHAKPKFFLGENEYKPASIEQEAILLLLISEIMLNIDPVLDMSAEHAESREETLHNAETLYNLLAVACIHLGQYELLSCCIEKSLKYAFDRHHIWHQYALSLCASHKVNHALSCFSECCQIKSDDAVSAMLAAKMCYEQLPVRVEQGLQYAQLAIKMSGETFESDGLQSRAHLCLGVGMTLKALSSLSRKERVACRSQALASYDKSHAADPYDHKPLLFLALEFSYVRKLSMAFTKVQQALDFQPEELLSLHLLTLLLTAKKQHKEAKQTLQTALDLYPDNMELLATKCRLEQHVGESDEALRTCDEIMRMWASKPESSVFNMAPDTTTDRMTNDALSSTNLSIGNELETASVMASSVAASKYGQTTSDVASSLADLQPRLAAISCARGEAWLQVAEVYLASDRPDESEACITEAVQIHPLSPTLLYMRGRLFEYRGEIHEACAMYNNALTIDPSHRKAIERLSGILTQQGKLGYAKKLLQDAIKLDVMSHIIWQNLAEVLEAEGDIDSSLECTAFALNLEETSPVVPFNTLIPSL